VTDPVAQAIAAQGEAEAQQPTHAQYNVGLPSGRPAGLLLPQSLTEGDALVLIRVITEIAGIGPPAPEDQAPPKPRLWLPGR
jgi:hypothetical protein